ncbi:PQQ-dependent sugar dehydrogenase [Planktomarina temperata]|nr:PQQ-dependent sugar dehydrogenase [Planktomarina temperata]
MEQEFPFIKREQNSWRQNFIGCLRWLHQDYFFYEGDEFYEWNGNAFIGGLKSKALVRIGFVDGEPFEAERFSWAKRVRDVEMDHDGAIWAIEDGPNGRLIKFTKPTE